MVSKTPNTSVNLSPIGPMACFGSIQRDPDGMGLMMEEIGGPGVVGTVLRTSNREDILMAMERILPVLPTREGSNYCGPFFWTYKVR